MKTELSHKSAFFLVTVLMSGGLVALALWLGKGQIAFVLFSLVLLYLGRKLGWWLSKASLYDDPLPVVLIECVIWGVVLRRHLRYLRFQGAGRK